MNFFFAFFSLTFFCLTFPTFQNTGGTLSLEETILKRFTNSIPTKTTVGMGFILNGLAYDLGFTRFMKRFVILGFGFS